MTKKLGKKLTEKKASSPKIKKTTAVKKSATPKKTAAAKITAATKKSTTPKKSAAAKIMTATKKSAAPKKIKTKLSVNSKAKIQGTTHHKIHSNLSREERNWGMYCHLAAFAGFIIPFGNIIGPLIIWLTKREDFPSIDRQGKEALNFQITMTIYFIVAFLLVFVLIGIVLVPALIVAQIIFITLAAMKAQDGGFYHYPFTIHFLK